MGKYSKNQVISSDSTISTVRIYAWWNLCLRWHGAMVNAITCHCHGLQRQSYMIFWKTQSHRIHVWNIYQHLPHNNDPNVGKYTIHGSKTQCIWRWVFVAPYSTHQNEVILGIIFLVGGFNLPLWKMMDESSMGRMTSHIWNGKCLKCSKPPTGYVPSLVASLIFLLQWQAHMFHG